jgi:NAD(P)-dependent dehydrogenase (short-subunit alcohol dehydrogenase family)
MEENQFILITGTSSGLGYQMATMLLEQGHWVIGLSRSGTQIDHSNFIDIICDIRDEESVEEMYELISHHTNKLDAIVLNAGIFEMAPLNETSSKEFRNHLDTNVIGAFHILKHAESFIEEVEAHIITISSLASKNGLSNMSAYSASKFALNGLIDSLRSEWAHLNVRFSTLLPGAISTPIWDEIEGDFPRDQMLSCEEFLHVFNMVFNSPKNLQFPELTFLHRDGLYK